jgi:hypothetical protein
LKQLAFRLADIGGAVSARITGPCGVAVAISDPAVVSGAPRPWSPRSVGPCMHGQRARRGAWRRGTMVTVVATTAVAI